MKTTLSALLLFTVLSATITQAQSVATHFQATDAGKTNIFMGKVGIGLTSPIYGFDVRQGMFSVRDSGDANTQMLLDRYSKSLSRYPVIYFRKSNTDTFCVTKTTLSGEYLGALVFRGVRSDNVFDTAASIISKQDGTAGSTVPGKIDFATSSVTTKEVVRMTIRSSGNVGIGTTAPTSKLHVSGNVNLNNALHVSSDGKIGIGTATPASNLHVNGQGLFTGGITFVAPLGDLSMGTFTNGPSI